MTDRLIIGRHPLDGSYGIWLSRPGYNAAGYTDPEYFLICPGVKNDMAIMSGYASHGQVVYFPETFTNAPFVYFNPTPGFGVDYYPFPLTVATTAGNTYCYVATSYMQFIDASGLGLGFTYLVVNRALP